MVVKKGSCFHYLRETSSFIELYTSLHLVIQEISQSVQHYANEGCPLKIKNEQQN